MSNPPVGARPPAFPLRVLEQHYGIDLAADGAFAREKEILERAAKIGLNRVMMGETWPNMGLRLIDYRETFPELATPEGTADAAKRRAVHEQIGAEARRLGIEPWVNINIINYPDAFTKLCPDAIAKAPATADRWLRSPGPKGLSKQPQICSSSESFRKLAVAQLTDLCRLPHVGGIECWLTAGDSDLFYCVCEKCTGKSISDRIVEFVETVHPVVVQHGKKLLMRPYLGGWRCALETEVWLEAAPCLPQDVEIGYKQQHGDLMNWHGPNPLAGRLAPHQELVEFDLQGEYRGINYGMVCSVRWQMQELIRHFRAKGVTGPICRGLDRAHFFDIDKWLFGALAQDPDLDVAVWSHAWAAQRYGAAGDEVLTILDECAEIMRLSMYVRGVQWASWAVPQNLARLRFILFDRCAPCVPNSYERLQPTPETLCAIIEEKQEARERADALAARTARLKGTLEHCFFTPLYTSVSYLRLYVSIAGPLMETFFRFLAWEKTSSEVTREYARIPLLESLATARRRIEEAHREIEALDVATLNGMMDAAGFVDPKASNKFLEPFRYATVILDDIEQSIDTPSASWWAYYPSAERWPQALRGRAELYRDASE